MKPTLALACLLAFTILPTATATHELPTPTAWWKFDETIAGPVVDSAGTNDGVNDGATIGVAGHFDTAYSFDGVDDRVQIPDGPDVDFTGQMTLSAWVTPLTISGRTDIISKERQYYLEINNGKPQIIFVAAPNLLAFETSVPTVTVGMLYHFAATANTVNDVHLYINGQEVAVVVTAGTFLVDPNKPVYIGDAPDLTDGEFHGIIDDVRIYQEALAPSQIEDLFLDPQHHACENQFVTFWDTIAPSLLIVFVIIGVAAALVGVVYFKVEGGKASAFLFIAFAMASLASTPEPATATHGCSFETGSPITDAVAIPLISLAFLSVLVLTLYWLRNRDTA